MNSNRTNEEIAQEILRRSQFITEKKLKKKKNNNDQCPDFCLLSFNSSYRKKYKSHIRS